MQVKQTVEPLVWRESDSTTEISLVDQGPLPYHGKDGVPRTDARLRWWNSTGRTLRDIAEAIQHFTTGSGEPYPPLPEPEVPHYT